MRTIIVTRYNENVSWTNTLNDRVIIYNKGVRLLKEASIPIPNKGREADTMLYYICKYYNDLTDETVFLQGNPFDHCKDVLKILRDNKCVKDVMWLGSNWGPVTKNADGGPGHGEFLPLVELSKLLFENCDFNEDTKFTFSAGAQYIVPKEFIKSKSLDWWKHCFDVFNKYLPNSPWSYERLWPLIWNYSTNH